MTTQVENPAAGWHGRAAAVPSVILGPNHHQLHDKKKQQHHHQKKSSPQASEDHQTAAGKTSILSAPKHAYRAHPQRSQTFAEFIRAEQPPPPPSVTPSNPAPPDDLWAQKLQPPPPASPAQSSAGSQKNSNASEAEKEEAKRREKAAEDAEYRERFKSLDRANWDQRCVPRSPVRPRTPVTSNHNNGGGDDDDGEYSPDEGAGGATREPWKRSYNLGRARNHHHRPRNNYDSSTPPPPRSLSFEADTPRDRPRRRAALPQIPSAGHYGGGRSSSSSSSSCSSGNNNNNSGGEWYEENNNANGEDDDDEFSQWFNLAFNHPMSKRRARERELQHHGRHFSDDPRECPRYNFGDSQRHQNPPPYHQRPPPSPRGNYASDDGGEESDDMGFSNVFGSDDDFPSDQSKRPRNHRPSKGGAVAGGGKFSFNGMPDIRQLIDNQMQKICSDPSVKQNVSASVETRGNIGPESCVRATADNNYTIEVQILFINNSSEPISVPLCVMMRPNRQERPIRLSSSSRTIQPGKSYCVFSADVKLTRGQRVWLEVDGSLPRDLEIVRSRTHLRS